MLPLCALSKIAELAGPARYFRVVRRDRSAVSEAAEVLARIEAERCCDPGRACPVSVPRGAVGLARVLDELQAVACGDATGASHVRHLTVEVHGHEEPRT